MSKEITKMSRLAGQLERMFNTLNRDFYNGELETPTITIQNTPRVYGHVSTWDAWSVKGHGKKELNVGAGTLNRPLEATVSTILHEMAHLYNMDVLNVQDCSRGGTYPAITRSPLTQISPFWICNSQHGSGRPMLPGLAHWLRFTATTGEHSVMP